MKQKGCAASRAEQKLRLPENLDARVCEAHFCSARGHPEETGGQMLTGARRTSRERSLNGRAFSYN